MSGAERSMETIYDDLWQVNALERWATGEPSLRPRPPGHLFDLVADSGLADGASMLDVGCGQGDHACELVRRFGGRLVAMDPVMSNVTSARDRVQQSGLAAQIQVQEGVVERIPFPDDAFDLVWCRSVIVHLPALGPAFGECWRVLAPDGLMLLQTGFSTELLEPGEAARLRQRMGFVEESMSRPIVEAALEAAGFTVVRSETYGSEFAEYYEKQEGRCAHHLLGIARLQRAESALVRRFGRESYETALGMYCWQVYQMLGKISYHAYVLKKAP